MITALFSGGHDSPLPACRIWPGSKITLNGETVDVLEINEAPDLEGVPQVSIKYRIDYPDSCLIGFSLVPAFRYFDILPNPDPF